MMEDRFKVMEISSTRANPGDQFYFSPESTLWKVSREQALILVGPHALLMQAAHPLIAEGVYDHSSLFEAPVKRLFLTLYYTYELVFGTKQEVKEAAKAVNRSHDMVKGTLDEAIGPYPAGTPYSAHDPELLMWVFATLVKGAIRAHEWFAGTISSSTSDNPIFCGCAISGGMSSTRTVCISDSLTPEL